MIMVDVDAKDGIKSKMGWLRVPAAELHAVVTIDWSNTRHMLCYRDHDNHLASLIRVDKHASPGLCFSKY